MKLKIGISCKSGMILSLTKTGNIRPSTNDGYQIGVAASCLRRGRIAKEIQNGIWIEEGFVDPMLSKISMSYIPGNKL